jgi:hypothetical protein
MSRKQTNRDKEEKQSFWQTVPGILTGIAAIIAAVGTLITALVTSGAINIGNPSPEPNPVTITLINEHCLAQDFYVDDQRQTTVAAESRVDFTISAGPHKVQACKAGTSECGDTFGPDWTTSTTWTIYRGSECPPLVTITLINDYCLAQDFYVDDELRTTVAAESTVDFTISAGPHKVQACKAGTSECGDTYERDWPTSTTWKIYSGPGCP